MPTNATVDNFNEWHLYYFMHLKGHVKSFASVKQKDIYFHILNWQQKELVLTKDYIIYSTHLIGSIYW